MISMQLIFVRQMICTQKLQLLQLLQGKWFFVRSPLPDSLDEAQKMVDAVEKSRC